MREKSYKKGNRIFFVCNDDGYAKALSSKMGINSIITSKNRMETVMMKNSNISGVVVLAELKWDEKKYTEFLGLEILTELRLNYQIKAPIAICSFFPGDQLRSKYPILDFPQNHPFISLPFIVEDVLAVFQKSEIADEHRLNDIIRSYCNVKGRLVHLITHGDGLSKILTGCHTKTPPNELWSACEIDMRSFNRYMSSLSEGSVLYKNGRRLCEHIKESIKTRNLKTLRKAKLLMFEFLIELGGM